MSNINDYLVFAISAKNRKGLGSKPRRDLLISLSLTVRANDDSVLYCYQFTIILSILQHFLPPNPLKIISLSRQKK